jgi:hypothetical protein
LLKFYTFGCLEASQIHENADLANAGILTKPQEGIKSEMNLQCPAGSPIDALKSIKMEKNYTSIQNPERNAGE